MKEVGGDDVNVGRGDLIVKVHASPLNFKFVLGRFTR